MRGIVRGQGAQVRLFVNAPDERGLAAGKFVECGLAKSDGGERTRVIDGRALEILKATLAPPTRVELRNVCKGEPLQDFKEPIRLLKNSKGIGIAEQRRWPGCVG